MNNYRCLQTEWCTRKCRREKGCSSSLTSLVTQPNAQKIKFYIKNIFILYSVKGVAMSISRTDKKTFLNSEFFLVRIFPHSDWIRRDYPYLSLFSPIAGKLGPKKTPLHFTSLPMSLIQQICNSCVRSLSWLLYL